MDFTKQTRRAAEIHQRYLVSGEKTCIDCHKGIAHLLPDMRGIEPGWQEAPELRGQGASKHPPEHDLHAFAEKLPGR